MLIQEVLWDVIFALQVIRPSVLQQEIKLQLERANVLTTHLIVCVHIPFTDSHVCVYICLRLWFWACLRDIMGFLYVLSCT